MSTKNFKKFYEITMLLLALLVVIITLFELCYELESTTEQIVTYIDNFIYVVFLLDYFTRLYLADNKIEFIKHNKIDLIVIIPFDFLFKIFSMTKFVKLLKVSKLIKLTRLLKLAALLGKVSKRIDHAFKASSFYYVTIATISLIFLGASFMSIAEDMTFGDALWWSIVTTSTVGYGDISPSTLTGRIIAVILMISGIGFLGMVTSTISTYLLTRNDNRLSEKKVITYKDLVIKDIKSQLDDFDNLSTEDLRFMFKTLYTLKSEDEIDSLAEELSITKDSKRI